MLINEIKELLKTAGKYFSKEEELLKNIVLEDTIKMDKDLIKLLMSNEKAKSHFFIEIEGIFVFDKDKFIKFVENKEFLPNSYTAYKNKIGLTDSKGEFLKEKNDVVLSWAYKDCYLEGGQDKEDMKKDEIFYNEILAPDEIDRLLEPKVLTNFKKYDVDGEHKVEDITMEDNLIIKGNNLLALHSLKEKYAGKIKLIYLDIPYNTGSDSFNYNDKFNHSTWLTFMKNRIEVAKNLLSDEGFIFVQTSYHMYPHLKLLLDEIFSNNYICTFNVLVRHPERILKADKDFHDVIEYIPTYSKNKFTNKIAKREEENTVDEYIYSINELSEGNVYELPDGNKMKYFLPNEYEEIKGKSNLKGLKKISIRGSLKEGNSSGRFYMKYLDKLNSEYPSGTLFKVNDMGNDSFDFRYFYLPQEGKANGGYYQGIPNDYNAIKYKPYSNFLDFVKEYNNVGYEGNVQLRNGKKPEALIKKVFEISGIKKGDIVLDFFMGSGTTCAVAHKLGIQYIGIEQMDYIEDITIQRLTNVIGGEKVNKSALFNNEIIDNYDKNGISEEVNWQGGGSFVYCELMKWNENFILKIDKAENMEDLLIIYSQIKERAFLNYKFDIEKFEEEITKSFDSLKIEEQKEIIKKSLDLNSLYVNLSEIEDETYNISDENKELNKIFYKK